MSKYVTMKVFDVDDMPEHIKKIVFSRGDEIPFLAFHGSKNNSYLEYCTDGGFPEAISNEYLNNWLFLNGVSYGETVLIYYWW